MLAACKARAAKQLRAATDRIKVVYEGQRTDRTSAVNGLAPTRAGERGFQCSFNASGRRIVRFVADPPQKVAERRNDSAERAGLGQFDASGEMPCTLPGQPKTRCPFQVARAGAGSATVVVRWPDGRSRALFFDKGKLTSADTSQADGYGRISQRKSGDLNTISVGRERYEFPDAVLFGG